MSMPTYFDRFNYPEDTAGWGFLGYYRAYLSSVFNISGDFNRLTVKKLRLGRKKKIDYSWGAVRRRLN
jgi:hypothetical protein